MKAKKLRAVAESQVRVADFYSRLAVGIRNSGIGILTPGINRSISEELNAAERLAIAMVASGEAGEYRSAARHNILKAQRKEAKK